MRYLWVLVLFMPISLTFCSPSVPTCEKLPVTDNGLKYDGKCPESSANCKWDQACVEGVCTTCVTAKECRRMQGCLPSGKCGACEADSQCETGKVCRSGYCVRSQMRVFDLQVDPQQWDNMRIKERYDKSPIPCALVVDGKTYPNCTVRPRGESSLDYRKLPLRITFKEDAKHPGYSRKINLRSEFNDRSYLRMVLAHDTFRYLTAIPSPRTRFIRLKVNGNDYGVYVEIERIGGKFLERHRRDRNASMYEADPQISHRTGISSLIPLPAQKDYPTGYAKKTGDEKDYSDLIRWIEEVIFKAYATGNTCALRDNLNTGLYLDYLAVMGIIQGKDHVRKNYFMSLQTDANGKRRWEFYPWDLDLTFGCVYTDKDLTNCKTFTYTEERFFGRLSAGTQMTYPTNGSFNLLLHTVLTDKQLRDEVDKRICTMLKSDFWQKRIFDLLQAYEAVLLPEVGSDAWDQNASVDDFKKAVKEVRSFITLRAQHLNKQIGCANTAPSSKR